MTAALCVALVLMSGLVIWQSRLSQRMAIQFIKVRDVSHANCLHEVKHYVGDEFAAQVLRLAAEDLESVEGQTRLRTIANTEYKIGGTSIPSLWLHDRADQLVEAYEETSDG